MHGAAVGARNKFPRFVRRERKDRREHFTQTTDESMQRGLRGATALRVGWIRVETILHDIVIDRGEFDGDELADLLVDDVKLVVVVSRSDFFFEPAEFRQNPAIKAREF